MTSTESKLQSQPTAFRTKGAALRVAALVISLIGLLLPAATSSAFGTTQSTSGFQIANWSILGPLAIGLALIMPGVTPRYGRLADIVAAVITAMVLIYLSYAVFDAWRQVSELTGQATDFMRGMAGNNSDMQAYANSYGQTLGVSVMPGFGLVAILVATSLMAMLSCRIKQ
ncbi:hypothetical protein [Devosia sp. Leaf64]|uniref:hypothetical protein n=1 Tax=Devosia sp. Leaf64 TaxID=1736229 RepID=UPI000714961A|nr:hypothetical protein [Devosia sp. Leaf64]KQN74799.1 hypothetical protein ASE94_00185 [Devosia sp. Leaf64]